MEKSDHNDSDTESLSVIKIRKDLTKWLKKKKPEHYELYNWLKGFELPAVGYNKDPYEWILLAFPASDETDFRREIAKRIAAFLMEEKPYKKQHKDYDDHLLYNLFYFCSGLRYPEELAESFTEIFDFFENNKNRKIRDKFFSEENFYNLNGAFREALIANQSGRKYQKVWQDLVNHQKSNFLRGNAISGVRGTIYMTDAENSYEPAIDQIGWSYKKFADYLVKINDENRIDKFRRLIQRIKDVWGRSPNFFENLNKQSIINKFPSWATDDVIFYPIQPSPEISTGERNYFAWKYVAESLKSVDKRIKYSHNNFVCHINVPKEARETVKVLDDLSYKVVCVRNETTDKSHKYQIRAIAEKFLHCDGDLEDQENTYARAVLNSKRDLIVFTQSEENQAQTEEVYKTYAASK